MQKRGTNRFKRGLVIASLTILILQIILALTGPPKRLEHWLDGDGLEPRENPRYVIVLGGAGMPAPSTLLRIYYAADYAKSVTNATFIVALPADNDPEKKGVGRMRDELALHGIPRETIQMETKGRNTREQAVNIAKLIGTSAFDEPIVIVSSDYHVRRATYLFRKVGFKRVAAVPASTVDAEADPGALAWLRYTIWRNAEVEIKILRELLALATSKISGAI